MEVYPQEITVVFLYSLCGTLISAPVCMFAEKNLTSFLLKPDVSLVSIMYTVRIQTLYLASTSDFIKKVLFLGCLGFIIGHSYTHVGSAFEGSSLHILVQAVVYCHCGWNVCYIPRWCNSPWKVPLSFTFFLHNTSQRFDLREVIHKQVILILYMYKW